MNAQSCFCAFMNPLRPILFIMAATLLAACNSAPKAPNTTQKSYPVIIRDSADNRAKAERVLRSRIYEIELEKQRAEQSADRKSQVGSGDRSEKIRTYNFKENRITDHRIGLTLYQLESVLEGNLDPVLGAVTTYFQAEKLKQEAA